MKFITMIDFSKLNKRFDKMIMDIPEYTKTDYDGIAKVLEQFVRLYEVSENPELIDKLLLEFFSPSYIIKNKEQ